MAQQKQARAVPVEGPPTLLLGGFDLARLGYAVEEYFVEGEAASYASDGPSPPDGSGAIVEAARAFYRTRVVVVRPADPAAFNGTAFVEWLNVSGGLDAPADWLMVHRELMRSGYAYVGISAQKVGIEGGPSLGADMSLKTTNPGRYSALTHPGDAFAFDIFSQAARLVRSRSADMLHGLEVTHAIAAGESQSAHFLTTYINAIDPIAQVFDGFLVHSRFGGAARLDGGSLMDPTDGATPVRFRADLRKPVLTFIAETDLLGGARPGYHNARQSDTDLLRVWEVAGTAHADNYTIQVGFIDDGHASIEALARAYAPTNSLMGVTLPKPINFAPQHHYVLQAGIAALDRWVKTGNPAPEAPRLALAATDPPTLVRDEHGLASSGVRTPWVNVPVARTAGDGNDGSVFATLFGSGELFDATEIAALYPDGKQQYLARFEAALDAAIAARFILLADREEIVQLADAMFPS